MLVIAIDGACRRNGKPDCMSAGGVFAQLLDDDSKILTTTALSEYESESTNQRGELLALLAALDYAHTVDTSTIIITDSEYIFNAITKEWVTNWERKGWVTASNEPVKNKDIWWNIQQVFKKCKDVVIYHIKGHVMPFGDVTARSLLKKDPSGAALLEAVSAKYESVVLERVTIERLAGAQDLSYKNNGFKLLPEQIKLFVTANTVADAIATVCVEDADASR